MCKYIILICSKVYNTFNFCFKYDKTWSKTRNCIQHYFYDFVYIYRMWSKIAKQIVMVWDNGWDKE